MLCALYRETTNANYIVVGLTGAWIEPTINLTLLEVSITTITRPIMLIGTAEYVNNGKPFEIVDTSLR